MKRVHISNLLKKQVWISRDYIVIYGKAKIEETEVKEKENKEMEKSLK